MRRRHASPSGSRCTARWSTSCGVSGRFDLLVEIVCESEDDFLNFLANHCFDQTDIARLEVMTGLAMYKNQFLLKQAVA